ncbi:MAG: DUF4230 domain-containing protein [Bacteroidetes bacterium]|nr:DUF4230 domain-containing protein [Bacteroidota bacterium]
MTYRPGSSAPSEPAPMMGRPLVLMLLLLLAAVVLYRAFWGDQPWFQTPKSVRLTYVDSQFQPNINEESALQILSNPEKYRQEFNDLVYNFNMSLLFHVANRLALPDSLKRKIEPAYQTHHPYLRDLYFNDFVALKDTAATFYENWYNDNANQAVQLFNEVSGKYTCFLVTQIMASMIKTSNGRYNASGKNVEEPCAIALREGLAPMVERLKKKAEILDFSASRGMLKETVRKGIAELATYEVRSRLGIDKSLQYKIFGLAISQTDIRVEAISVVKAGFKLDDYFDVTFSPKKGVVFVTLPPPSILSHEVYPRVDKLDVGFLAGISGEEMNNNFNELRRQFRQEAIEQEHVLDKAKIRADSVMQLMLGPMVRSMNRKYKLQVRFQDGSDANTPQQAVDSRKTSPIHPTEPPRKPRNTGFIPQ